MEIGRVRIAEDADFHKMKELINSNQGWKLEYSKNTTNVWTKTTEQTNFKMIKVKMVFKDIKPSLLFDVLLDPKYRPNWDKCMLESYDLGYLNPNNDIGYYAVNCPAMIKNRDFVLLRSWLETESEYLLLNHSVFHKSLPPKKGFVRAYSYLTGFVIRPEGEKGALLNYITHCDPRGSLPAWFVNKITQHFAPKTVKRLHKACLGYEAWKSAHNAGHKPWLYPEQITLKRIALEDCVQNEKEIEEDLPDESNLQESTCDF